MQASRRTSSSSSSLGDSQLAAPVTGASQCPHHYANSKPRQSAATPAAIPLSRSHCSHTASPAADGGEMDTKRRWRWNGGAFQGEDDAGGQGMI